MAFSKIISASLVLGSVVLLLAACSKDKVLENGNKSTAANNAATPLDVQTTFGTDTKGKSTNELFSAFRYVPQTYSVSAGQYWRVWGDEGTMLCFYPNSFKDAAGNIITEGNIEIKLVEMYKPGDMIANRATTTVDGGLLTSGGQIDISATMNGRPVYANKYRIGFKQMDSSAQPMRLYYGNLNNPDTVVNWSLPTASGPGTEVSNTSVPSNNTNGPVWYGAPPPLPTTFGPACYYVFDSCTDFHMINCDYFSGYPSLTGMTVTMTNPIFDAGNTTVYLVLPTINCVTSFRKANYTAGTHTFSLGQNYHVPIGMTATLVVLANRNGVFYYYTQPNFTITENMALTPAMQEQSLAFIKNALANL